MRGKAGPATALLRPILDMYMDAPVAVVGCQSRGLQRESCEWDVVVVTNEKRSPTSVRMGGVYLDLSFVTEKEALNPSNPEHSLSMATAKPVRDSSLILSTSSAANTAVQREASRKASAIRLASALKTLGRSEEALNGESLRVADFWMLASSYELAYAWLYSSDAIPSPSHLLSQIRVLSKSSPKHFETISKGAGLERAGRAACGSRMDGLTVLHDVVQGSPHGRGRGASSWSKARLDIVRAKAQDLASRIELAECYSYMGQEMVDYVMTVASRGQRGVSGVSEMFSGESPLLSDRLLRGLGLSRNRTVIKQTLDRLRDTFSALARSQ